MQMTDKYPLQKSCQVSFNLLVIINSKDYNHVTNIHCQFKLAGLKRFFIYGTFCIINIFSIL